jgi:hypothetical protein
METLNFSSLLAYGAIGLGCILAVLAYFLLRREQDQQKPRKQILTSVYVFMAFSLVLTCLGFGAELWKDSASRNSKSGQRITEVQGELTNMRNIMKVLMDQKVGKVTRLKQLTPSDPSYAALVAEIQADLERFDNAMTIAIQVSTAKPGTADGSGGTP